MFNFSGNKKHIKVTDIVWMTQDAKWNGLLQRWKKDHPVILCWFEATLQDLQSWFSNETGAAESLLLASHIHPSQLSDKSIVFAEHYPLRKKETELFERLQPAEIVIHSALDEPLFTRFGGDRIIRMMKQMGMAAEESLQHTMISQAILHAQEKIEKKVPNESLATSAGEWMERNMRS